MKFQLPPLGFGTAAIAGLYKAASEADAVNTLKEAIKAARSAGMTPYLDSALHYGAGNALIRMGIALGSLEEAKKTIISFKTGRLLVAAHGKLTDPSGFVDGGDYNRRFDYSYAGTIKAFEQSMVFLNEGRIKAGLEAIKPGDIPIVVFVHDPGRAEHGDNQPNIMKQVLEEAYPALMELKKKGWIQAIGIGTNEVAPAREALKHPATDIILLAGRFTLLSHEAPRAPKIMQEHSKDVQVFLREAEARGVQVVPAGLLNSGVFAEKPTYNYAPAPDDVVKYRNELVTVFNEHGTSVIAGAIQFPLLMGSKAIKTLLAGAGTAEEVASTMAAYKHPIPTELWGSLQKQGLLHPEIKLPAAGWAARIERQTTHAQLQSRL